ncbi:hypothetical protein [Flavobacterium cerinum]|uniref:Uncharacterized protein n=1 Tax=Flavobacterium cerinum TaxID=2502784 RepID=A0ABY5IV83_9FLAO|nr:hypothetical protein [Flavobacterium cerinum]UUC46705.1 hypothetical protein NOX80_05770 [Flavobacterium cerinum]
MKKKDCYVVKNGLPKEYKDWVEMEVVLSKKDTSYSYSFLGIDYLKKIMKLSERQGYVSIYEMKGLADFKREIYYNSQFEIDSIIEMYDDDLIRYK